MKIQNEQYREFEWRRFVYVGSPEGPHTQETQTPAPEAAKTPEQRAEELARKSGNHSTEFKQHSGRIDRAINGMIQGVPEGSAVDKIAKKLREHKDKKFDNILDDYEAKYQRMGKVAFNETDQFDALVDAAEQLANEIVDRIDSDEAGAKKATSEFLAKTPDTVASPKEIKAMKDMIQANPTLKELFGESANVDKLAQNLARKYDITFRGNQVDYAVDISTVGSNTPSVLTDEQLQDAINVELSGLNTQEKINQYLKTIGEEITPLVNLRNEVREIDEWEDFDGHEEVQALQRMQENVNRRIQSFKEARNSQLRSKNTEAYLKFDVSCQSAVDGTEGISIDQYPIPDDATITSPDFRIQPLAIRVNGEVVGHIHATEGGATIKLSGQPDSAAIPLDQLGARLQENVGRMQETAVTARQNREQIRTQLDRDSGALQAGEGLTLQTVDIADNQALGSNEGRVQFASVRVGEREVGQISVQSGGTEGARKYVATINGQESEFDSIADVQTHLTQNREQMVAAGVEQTADAIADAAQANPQLAKTMKKMGLMEMLGGLGQLFKMFQEAFRTGDWQSLTDAMNDFNGGKNPQEQVRGAKETYETEINKIQSTSDLLSLYREPYGEKAKALFQKEGQEAVPYRIQMKSVIEAKLQAVLGLSDVSSMENIAGNRTKIVAYRGESKYTIYLDSDGANTMASLHQWGVRDNGSEYEMEAPLTPKTRVQNLTEGPDNLAQTLFEATPAVAPATETTAPPAESTTPASETPTQQTTPNTEPVVRNNPSA